MEEGHARAQPRCARSNSDAQRPDAHVPAQTRQEHERAHAARANQAWPPDWLAGRRARKTRCVRSKSDSQKPHAQKDAHAPSAHGRLIGSLAEHPALANAPPTWHRLSTSLRERDAEAMPPAPSFHAQWFTTLTTLASPLAPRGRCCFCTLGDTSTSRDRSRGRVIPVNDDCHKSGKLTSPHRRPRRATAASHVGAVYFPVTVRHACASSTQPFALQHFPVAAEFFRCFPCAPARQTRV